MHLPWSRTRTTVIIPTYNEAGIISSTISTVRSRARSRCEVIVVDGQSADATRRLARSAGAKVLSVRGGRAAQLNAGASRARADTLLFLHADTAVPNGFDAHIRGVLAGERVIAGTFSLGIDSRLRGVGVVQRIANWRAKQLQMPYGDQGLFMGKREFRGVGGYPEMPFLEDYVMVKRIRQRGSIAISPEVVTTSGRRWETLGVVQTTVMNQVVIGAYHLGVPVQRLGEWYRGTLRRVIARKNMQQQQQQQQTT